MKYWLLLCLFCSSLTLATQDLLTFRDAAQEQEYQRLTQSLRCPKCQNSSIADSGSVIAADMRQKVYALLQQGKTEPQVVDYMVARYGHFVSYEPPLTPLTWLLWGGPLTVVLLGGGVIIRRSRQKVEVADSLVPQTEAAPFSVPLWQWLPGIALTMGLSAFLVYQTGNIPQVQAWKQATAQTPTLLAVWQQNPQEISDHATLSRLALGMRTRLQAQPDDVNGWIELGRIGYQLDNAPLVIQAFEKARDLDPDNPQATLGLAEALTRSSSAEDITRGGVLLREMIMKGNVTLAVLNLYAVNAQQQQHWQDAVIGWKAVLKLLPAEDPRKATVEGYLAEAQRQLAMQ
ncbi:cytochrome c biogenesis protein CcmH [Enterobacteriaceae bacterium RIT691]|nr:cytochrome c biogenesis protein CcmH [Enterobacteriaceae bacterium RIT691]